MSSIRKRILQSGLVRWMVDYRDGAGKRRAKQFPTKRAAEQWQAETLVAVRAGTHTPDSQSITVDRACELWLKRCEDDGLERSTVRSYEAHVDHHIKPIIGAEKLSSLTVPRIIDLVDELGESRSAATTRKVIGSLGAAISNAQGRGLVNQNVVRHQDVKRRLKQLRGRRHKAQIVIPAKEDLRALLANVSDDWRPFLIVAMFTGVRSSELRGARIQDVDIDRGVVRVRQRADKYCEIGPPKSAAGHRDIPIGPFVQNTLREWLPKVPRGEAGLLFPNGAGNVERPENILRRFYYPLMEKCELLTEGGKPKFTFHALRHAAASLLIEQGHGPKRIQKIMGHASIQTTFDIYGHLFDNPERDAKVAEAIENEILNVEQK